ncbi:hypothetical protein HOE31_00110 [bacterium]|jgi:hypothetical protein|nr:hypothetical protein [bacterium]MBT4121344.1 hypothetical protein [bacterium]MBT4335461.1 hypothetical protein [bacterium]MBT4495246.1 hypothetical protein [bacterium]MBT4763855.1 hypothetical protein [bacterium]
MVPTKKEIRIYSIKNISRNFLYPILSLLYCISLIIFGVKLGMSFQQSFHFLGWMLIITPAGIWILELYKKPLSHPKEAHYSEESKKYDKPTNLYLVTQSYLSATILILVSTFYQPFIDEIGNMIISIASFLIMIYFSNKYFKWVNALTDYYDHHAPMPYHPFFNIEQKYKYWFFVSLILTAVLLILITYSTITVAADKSSILDYFCLQKYWYLLN